MATCYNSLNIHPYFYGSAIFGPIKIKFSEIVSHAWKDLKLFKKKFFGNICLCVFLSAIACSL